MALVDPGGDRHELDGVDAEAGQVVEDRRVGEGGDGAADGGGHVGVEEGEGADGDLVDQAAGPEDAGAGGARRGEGGDDRLRHQVRGVDGGVAGGGEAGVVGEGAVEGDGVGVDEELRRVEPVAALGGEGAVGAEAVAGAGADAGDGRRRRCRRRRGRGGCGVSRSPSKRQSQTRVAAARPDGEAWCRRGSGVAPSGRAGVGSGDDVRLGAAGEGADAGDAPRRRR